MSTPHEPPDVSATAVLRTLLVSDLVGSTALTETLGDERAFQIFGLHDRAARDLMRRHDALEIDKTDGFLLLFERSIDAARYALAYHRVMAELSKEHGVALSSRVGIHLGEVFLRENPPNDVARGAKPIEVEGLAKPMAARLMSAALGGQTLLTRGAFDLARRAAVGGSDDVEEIRWIAHGAYMLKGVDEQVPIFEVGVEGWAPLAPPPATEKVRPVGDEDTVLGWRPALQQDVPLRANWRLEKKLGEGGFGEVWLARHRKTNEPRVFKFCFDRERLKGLQREVTLFRLLKEAIGNRDDIARILDWNFDKAPYFVESEYTEGGSLKDWAKRKGGIATVSVEQRLGIAAQIGEALAAAHSVGVLHKDIKPANILIAEGSDGTPRARLTDFGIGLITDSARLESHGITALGFTGTMDDVGSSATGTWQYMAPELLEGRPATVQADIFALGVICYQLVVGNLDRVMAPGWEREVPDEVLRSDISAMVDGSPERRLTDASDVARRLHYLDERRERLAEERRQREIAAHTRRELAKTRSRRKIVVAAVVFLVLFSAAMAYQARRIAVEARRANRAAEAARQVSKFLIDVFEVSDPGEGRGNSVTARELLDQGARKVRQGLEEHPLTRARMAEAMGLSYLQLGLYSQAEPLLEQAFDLRSLTLAANDPRMGDSHRALGRLYTRQGRYDEAESRLDLALELCEANGEEGAGVTAVTLTDLAELMRVQGRHAEALPFVQRAEALSTLDASEGVGGDGVVERVEEQALLSVHRSVALPADVSRVLGSAPRGGLVMAVGSQGSYQIDMEGRVAPIVSPLAPGEEVVSWVEPATMVVRVGDRLVFRELFRRGGVSERVVHRGLGAGDTVVMDRRGRRIGVLGDRGLKVFAVGGAADPLATFQVDQAVNGLVLGERWVAWVGNEGVCAGRLDTGEVVLEARDWEGRAGPMALHESAALLAVGGFFDEVVVYDLFGGRLLDTFALPGQTGRMIFLDDHPTLIVAKEGLVAAWRRDGGVVARFDEPGRRFAAVDLGSSGLLVHDLLGDRLMSLSYRSFPVIGEIAVSSAHLWAMTADSEGGTLFAGAADGQLHAIDLERGRLRSVQAHTQGVTSVLCRDGEVVTGADDKMIAVWDADTLEEMARTQAHEYLVNFLFWENGSSSLWTSSSDHRLKRWSWPMLDELEVVELEGGSKAGFWVDTVRGRALVGTWGHGFLDVRVDGDWRVQQTVETTSSGVYSVVEVPDVAGVLLLGVTPTNVWFYDLETERASRLPDRDLLLEWAVPVAGDRVVLLGASCAASFVFRRGEDGVGFEISVGLSTDIGRAGVGAFVGGASRVAVGTVDGRVLFFSADDLPATVLERGIVGGR